MISLVGYLVLNQTIMKCFLQQLISMLSKLLISQVMSQLEEQKLREYDREM